MAEATTSDEPQDDDIEASDAALDAPVEVETTEPGDEVEERAAVEDDEFEASGAEDEVGGGDASASDLEHLGASVAPFAGASAGTGATGSDGVRGWVSSEGGRKIVPAASGALIILGALLIVVSLFSGGSDVPPVAPVGAQAQGQLTKAMAVAKEYLTQDKPHTYRRFSAAEAEAADPTLVWNIEKKAVEGEVSIRVSGETGIVLATKDVSGNIYCISDVNAEDEVSKGTVDAAKPEQCKGGW